MHNVTIVRTTVQRVSGNHSQQEASNERCPRDPGCGRGIVGAGKDVVGGRHRITRKTFHGRRSLIRPCNSDPGECESLLAIWPRPLGVSLAADWGNVGTRPLARSSKVLLAHFVLAANNKSDYSLDFHLQLPFVLAADH